LSSQSLAQPSVHAEEKCLVLLDWAAEGTAIIVPPEFGQPVADLRGWQVKVIPRIQDAVPQKFKSVSVKTGWYRSCSTITIWLPIVMPYSALKLLVMTRTYSRMPSHAERVASDRGTIGSREVRQDAPPTGSCWKQAAPLLLYSVP